jgi:hypothetical protein
VRRNIKSNISGENMAQIVPIIRRIAAGVLPLILVVACATSTKLVNVWQDPAFTGGPMKKIIVLGLGSDGAMSQNFEDIFAAELKRRGVEAVPGHTLLPQDPPPTREAMERAAKTVGADGFLVARLVKTDKETQYSPGFSPTAVPGVGSYNNFYGYYSAAVTYAPPVAYQYEVVTVETNLWDVSTDKLVWAGTTQTFAPGSVSQEAPGFAKLIINSLAERKLIPAKS